VTAPTSAAAGGEVSAYLTWLQLERGRARNTIAAYRRDLRAYEQWLTARGRTPTSAAEDDIVAYLHHRRSLGHAPATVARAMVAVRSLHHFLVVDGHRADDPSAAVEQPRVPRGLPKALSEAEVMRLLDAVDGTTPADRRDRAALEVLYGTGVRISELVGLSLADLDLGDRSMRVLGKGSKERVVPLGRCAATALGDWLGPGGRGALEPSRWRSRTDADAVFLNTRGTRLSRQGAWGIIKKRGAAVGLGARLSPHTLRHCCATHMLDHGADIRAVQELLGHASVTTTQIYTLVSREQLIAVYEAAHPRARA
jgi:integrase/recombinase XerD